jgi:hypothetical protein
MLTQLPLLRLPHTLLRVSAYVSIRQHTSAFVSIRQHTSAYVSIRQLTSAYVSIRQFTSCALAQRNAEAIEALETELMQDADVVLWAVSGTSSRKVDDKTVGRRC